MSSKITQKDRDTLEEFIGKQGKVDQKLLDAVEKKLEKALSVGRRKMGRGIQQPKKSDPMVITLTKGQVSGIKDAPEERRKEKESKAFLKRAEAGLGMKEGGLAEATARLKAKGMKEGGMVVKDKVVAIDKSPNSGLITVKGFGASRRT